MGGGGPIVRKYGFPNFEKIFGEKPLEHGVEEKTKEAGERKDVEKKPKKKPKQA